MEVNPYVGRGFYVTLNFQDKIIRIIKKMLKLLKTESNYYAEYKDLEIRNI